jgi:two-component system cell cycle sensor histidine kinase/response regulator CckA
MGSIWDQKGREKVLLMDDEAEIREVAIDILNYLGFDVTVAEDGIEAINKYVTEMRKSGHPFDAVIMDLSIPGGMGGKECIQKLKKIDPDVKALVSSGYSFDPVIENFQDYGFLGIVPKPYEIETLSQALLRVFH